MNTIPVWMQAAVAIFSIVFLAGQLILVTWMSTMIRWQKRQDKEILEIYGMLIKKTERELLNVR